MICVGAIESDSMDLTFLGCYQGMENETRDHAEEIQFDGVTSRKLLAFQFQMHSNESVRVGYQPIH